jgi:hypothetical protein
MKFVSHFSLYILCEMALAQINIGELGTYSSDMQTEMHVHLYG